MKMEQIQISIISPYYNNLCTSIKNTKKSIHFDINHRMSQSFPQRVFTNKKRTSYFNLKN